MDEFEVILQTLQGDEDGLAAGVCAKDGTRWNLTLVVILAVSPRRALGRGRDDRRVGCI